MKRRNLAILIKSTYILAITFITLIGLTLAQYSWGTDWTPQNAPTDGNTVKEGHFTDIKNAIDGIYNAITIQDNHLLARNPLTEDAPETALATKKYVDETIIIDGTFIQELNAGGGDNYHTHIERTTDCPDGTYVCGVRTLYNGAMGHERNGIAYLYLRCCAI